MNSTEFDEGVAFSERREAEILNLELDGYEGPLDLLLGLSRSKKIDLAQLSMAELAQQYILYIERMRSERLEIAADYLVMAAWLAFLKSKLMLPQIDDGLDEPSGDELAAQLAFRLKRLAAMREKAQQLMARDQLGQDFFARPAPEGFELVQRIAYQPDFYGLLKAYASQRQRVSETRLKMVKREVWSIKKARNRLQKMLGMPIGWAPINDLIVSFLGGEDMKKTTVASTFGASLELARDGVVELRQGAAFSPLYIKAIENEGESRDE
ncbi:MAG: segregation/condensation protein A [Rhodomicrobium sp.]|nr:MAG: segregation/condensation protein A [Rhodomicrobium sp.]